MKESYSRGIEGSTAPPPNARMQLTLSSRPPGGLKTGESAVEDIQEVSEEPPGDDDIPF